MPTIHNQANDSGLHLRIPRIGGFTLLEPLCEGSCGLMYRARQDRVGRMVALKLLPEWPPATDVALERFNRAAYVNAQVQHPNLLTLYDFGTVDGYHFTSLELISGQTLQKHLSQNGPMDETFGLKIAEQLLSALVALHSRDICHRNIKPKNIFIEVTGKVRLIGLGLASCKSAFFSPHLDARPIGTPHFMAPEMIRGSFSDPRSDLYSIGVTLFVATTGRTPFEKGSPMAVMSKHLTETPVSLHEVRPTLSREFCAFVDTLMARDLTERFQSAKVALDMCQALIAQREVVRPAAAKNSMPPVLLIPMRPKSGRLKRAMKNAGVLLHNPVVVILASAVVTVGLLVGLTAALRTWSSDGAKPIQIQLPGQAPITATNGVDPQAMTSIQREMLRLSRSEELYRKQPATGVAAWRQFLVQNVNAPADVKEYAQNQLNLYLLLNGEIRPEKTTKLQPPPDLQF